MKKQKIKGLVTSDKATLKAVIDKDTGFLTAPVNLSRTGVQTYLGFELGLDDRALEKIGVFRSEDQVFDEDSVSSFTNLVVTDDHPKEMVCSDNVKKLQVGTVSGVKQTGDTLSGVVTITDKDVIKKIKDGKVEVSVGYRNELEKEKGTHDGVPYDFKQTKIRANHLAIVDAGRCGSACKLTVDKKESLVEKITIDGIDFKVEDKQLVQAIEKQQAAHDAEKENLKERFKKKMSEKEEENEDMEKKKDKAEAAKDAADSMVLDKAALNTLISDRAILLVDAGNILGDKMPECTDCPLEIKTAVIDHVMPEMKLDGKSKDYINAAYDIAINKAKSTKESLDDLANDFKSKDGKVITRDTARTGYGKTLGLEI